MIDPAIILQGGAVAVFLLVFAGAVRGDLRFRPGIEGEVRELREQVGYLKAELVDARAHRDRLTEAVEKLGDALEARNRRDEQAHRQ